MASDESHTAITTVYQVYLGYDKSGTDVYVGIMNNLGNRQSKHGGEIQDFADHVRFGSTRGEARAVAWIESNGYRVGSNCRTWRY